jgi:ABC-type transporter Mla MlaB component
MLRISNLGSEEKVMRLRLDGRLSGPWVEELRRMCEAALKEEQTLIVDCEGLFFADAEGAALMRTLRDQGAALVNCSAFLKLQLEEAAV